MRKWLALAAGLAVLVAANATVFQRERLLAEGRVAILELAPLDPRSLMQGDYMALRFKLAQEAGARRASGEEDHDGRLVVRPDVQGVARFVRREDGAVPGEGEFALRYRVRRGDLKFATNAFFFQEGHGPRYARARYGEFRVAPSGEMLLTHLLDENRQRLGDAPR